VLDRAAVCAVTGVAVTAHAVFSLQHSEFNEFLFAQIGPERNDSLLTVLSALARVGLDPWQEAARLSRQTSEAAIASLALIIAGVPNGQWARSDSPMIAARLIALLPRPSTSADASRAAARRAIPGISRTNLALVCASLCFGALVLFTLLRPSPDLGQSPGVSQSTVAPAANSAPPEAPFPGSK
jgi:hypothetical protein